MHEVDEAMRLLLTDGRRSPSDAAAAQGFWVQEFGALPDGKLLEAVRTWMREKPRGRPSVGELWGIIQPASSQPPPAALRDEREVDRRLELLWAISVLSAPERYQDPKYRHTLEYAEKCLSAHGFAVWQDAKRHLFPGWNQPTVREVSI